MTKREVHLDFIFHCSTWENSSHTNASFYDNSFQRAGSIPSLYNHFINAPGFSELAFRYAWLMVLNELHPKSNILEIGVYKGSTLSLFKVISDFIEKDFNIFGLTPLENIGDKYSTYDNVNYYEAICKTFELAGVNIDKVDLIKGLSTSVEAQKKTAVRDYDLVFIDGGHDYDTVVSDIKFTNGILKKGGVLAMDDASADLDFPVNFIGFKGHGDVAKAIRDSEILKNEYDHLFACGHNRFWKKL